jgi:hypothetical protein
MTDIIQNLPLAFALLFGAIMVALGLILLLAGLATLRDTIISLRWPRATGRILSSEVRREERLEEQTVYRPEVSYTFACGGGTFTGRKIAFAEKLYHSEAAARKAIEPYPAGMVVTVLYDPDSPEEAVLERRGALAGIILLLLGAAMVAAPLALGAGQGIPVGPILAVIAFLFAVIFISGRQWRLRRRRVRQAGLYPPPGQGNDQDVERLLREGEKLLAIRLYREVHGTDLKTSRLKVREMAERLRRS